MLLYSAITTSTEIEADRLALMHPDPRYISKEVKVVSDDAQNFRREDGR